MKNLHAAPEVASIKARVNAIHADSPRQWGKMDAAQALAHCTAGIEMALGEIRPRPKLLQRVVGAAIKPLVLGNDKPMQRNAPTIAEMIVSEPRVLETERARLLMQLDRFAAEKRECSTHPHPFFGQLSPDEWAILMFKHLDHHLRQFSA